MYKHEDAKCERELVNDNDETVNVMGISGFVKTCDELLKGHELVQSTYECDYLCSINEPQLGGFCSR